MGPDIWVVRHGETEWSASLRHTGRSDIPLTDEGRRHAASIYKRLDAQAFSLVLTSPLVRARETAKIAGFADAYVTDDLVEWDYGDYEGRTTAEIRESEAGWLVWTSRSPNAESIEELGTRVDRVLDRVSSVEGRVLIFGHGHCLRVLTARALGLAPIAGQVFTCDPASIGIVGFEHDYRALRQWNWRPSAS